MDSIQVENEPTSITVSSVGKMTLEVLSEIPADHRSAYMRTSEWDFLIEPIMALRVGDSGIRLRCTSKAAAKRTAEAARAKVSKLKFTKSANGPACVSTWCQPVDRANTHGEWYTYIQKQVNTRNRIANR